MEFSTNRFYRLSLRWFVALTARNFSFPSQYEVICYISFLISQYANWDLFRWYWNVRWFPVQQITLIIFNILHSCDSNGLILSPVCMVHRITLKTRFMLSIKPILSSKLAMITFFTVCIAHSTAPSPACSLGRLNSFSILLFLEDSLYFLDMKALPLSDFIFYATP